jgi:putative ABC transport system permease protein
MSPAVRLAATALLLGTLTACHHTVQSRVFEISGPLTTTQEEQIARRMDGVDAVYGRVHAVTHGITVTADPGAGPFSTTTLCTGRYPLGPDEIAVTPRTARQLRLRIGSRVNGTSLTVTGTATGREDRGLQAYAPQTTVSAIRGSDRLDGVDVRVRPGVDPATVKEQIEVAIRRGSW